MIVRKIITICKMKIALFKIKNLIKLKLYKTMENQPKIKIKFQIKIALIIVKYKKIQYYKLKSTMSLYKSQNYNNQI